jgi:TolB-like protein
LGSDPKGDKFADLMTEDVITDLSHSKDFAVIARNSTEVYKGKAVDVRSVGKDLNVKYVLEGSVQALSGKVVATAQLIDAASGSHIWSEKVENQGDDIFAVQAEVTSRISQSIIGHGNALSTHERKLVRRKPPSQWSAYEAYEAGLEAKHTYTLDGVVKAEELFNRALEIDPNFARAQVGLVWAISIKINVGGESEDSAVPRMQAAADKALALDPLDGEAHAAYSEAYSWSYDRVKMRQGAERAVELAPNNADVLVLSSYQFAAIGEPQRAIDNISRALRLNPRYPVWYNWIIRNASYISGDLKRSHDFGQRAGYAYPVDFEIQAITAAAIGKSEESSSAKQSLLKVIPEWTAEERVGWWAITDVRDVERFVANARSAELPICMSVSQARKSIFSYRLPQCDAERAKVQ